MMNKFVNSNLQGGTYKQQQQLKDKFMTSTHAYYSVQHFWAKDNSGQASPVTSMSICIEDSFTDVVDNDTSERHIVVQVETPPKNQKQPFSQITDKFYNSQNQKTHQSRVQDAGLKYSVAMPIPTQPGVTPGEKSAKSKTTSQWPQYDKQSGANPKQLHFIDKIQEDNGAQALDGGQSISTNPSNSGYDIVVNPIMNQSRQNPFQMSGKQNFHTIDHPANSGKVTKRGNLKKNQPPKTFKDSMMDEYMSSHRSTHRGGQGATFHSKMDDFLYRKEAKLRVMREAKELKELEGCQFAPNIYTRKENQAPQRRGFEQFLQDQRRFIENVRSKRDQRLEIQEQIEVAAIQHGSYLSTRSRQILQDKEKRTMSCESREGSVISAGVSENSNKGQNKMNTLKSPRGATGPFGNTLKRKNAIEVHRDRPVEEILYQDAIRRQHSIESRQKEAIQKCREPVPLVGRESQKIVIQKFEREVNTGIYDLFQTQRELKLSDLAQKEPSSQQVMQLPGTMNYLIMKLLMVKLGCCSEEQTFTECAESDHLFQMWKHLSQDHDFLRSDHDELPTDRLKLFLMVILRVAEARVLQDYLAQNEHGFNFEEAPALIKRFDLFYINRIKEQAKQQIQKKSEMESLQTKGMSFRPQLSENTIQLAQRKHSKMQPNHLLQTQKPGTLMTNFFQTHEAKEIQQCTFQPYVSENSRKLSSTRKLMPGELPSQSVVVNIDKCSELFEFSKQLQQMKKTVTDKTTEEVEYQRSKEECTFKPQIHMAPKPGVPKFMLTDPQMTKLHLERQSRAREEKARVKDIKERGWSKSNTRSLSNGNRDNHQQSINSQLVAQRHKESVNRSKLASAGPSRPEESKQPLRIPLLLVDIGIGDRKERIAVYEGDRAETLAKDFCKRNGLDMENIALRLQEEIERQIEIITQQQRQKAK